MGLRKPAWYQGGIEKPRVNPVPFVRVMYGIFIGHGEYSGKFLLKKLYVKEIGDWEEDKDFLFVGSALEVCRKHPALKGLLKIEIKGDTPLIENWF